MALWEVAVWALLGAISVEGFDLVGAIRRTKSWPWTVPGEPRGLIFAVAVTLRILSSAVLASAVGFSGQVNTPISAYAIGIAAPLLMERILRQVLPANGIQSESIDRDGMESPNRTRHVEDSSGV